MTTIQKTPYCHFELMTQQAEDKWGGASYVFVLKPSYQTDGSETVLMNNLKHSADVLNNLTIYNPLMFPYCHFENRKDQKNTWRWNAWVYVSQRLIPTQTKAITDWMLLIAQRHYPVGLKIDSDTVGSIIKLKWESPNIK